MRNPQLSLNDDGGFSLLELLLVMTLSVILAAFAYSLHHQHTLKVQRLDAHIALYDLAYRMERYYALHHSYEKASLGTGKATDIKETVFSPEKRYILSIDSQSKTTYTLRATAQGNQASDEYCAFMTLNQAGGKSSSTEEQSISASCWS